MSDSEETTGNRKGAKRARRSRQPGEKLAGQALDRTAGDAVDIAMGLAAEVAEAPTLEAGERVIDVELASISEANFVRKRVNAALHVGEWLDAVAVWVWQADSHQRPPLSDRGRERGFELRLEPVGPRT